MTHSPNYNQAARNIACLAKLILPYENLHENCRFLVFSPNVDNKGKVDKNYITEETIDNIIKDQKGKRNFKSISDKGTFYNVVESIRENSRVIFWEDIIESMPFSNDKTELSKFYKECLFEYKHIKTQKTL